MASTVPAKSSNLLHNFDLPHLKWNNNNTNNNNTHHHSNNLHRRRSRHDSPIRDSVSSVLRSPIRDPLAGAHRSPLLDSVAGAHRSPLRDSVAGAHRSPLRDSVAGVHRSPLRDSVAGVRRSPLRDSVAGVRSPMRDSAPAFKQPSMRDSLRPRHSPSRCTGSDKDKISFIEYRRQSRISSDKIDKQRKVTEADASVNRSKILIKLPRKEPQQLDEPQQLIPDDEDAVPKTWNLRPRRPIHKSLNINGAPFRETKPQSPENNTEPNASAPKKEKRLRFSISLSREQIDEDIYAMTGSKPARRPKKRVKALQKQLDTLFPGLWLASITPDSYKVCENLSKG